MSISIITSADIPVITRTGSLINATDTGVDMNFDVSGTFSVQNDVPPVGPLAPIDQFCGHASGGYTTGGDVDFDHIITDIPDAAQIHKIDLSASAEYNIQSDVSGDISVGSDVFDHGSAVVSAGLNFLIPNTAFTPNTDNHVSESDSDSTGISATTILLSASVFNAGLLMSRIYDIANDPGQYPLGYITRAQLVTQFTTQKMSLTSGFARGVVSVAGAGANFVATDAASLLCSISSSLWVMTITWELPFSWTLDTPTDPIQAGDHVTASSPAVDGIDWTQVTGVTLVAPDGTSTVISFTAIDATHFIFTVPTLVGSPPIVNVVITSTQFTGSVTLGKLATIFFLNATGIYTLVPGKTNDTIYDNDDPGTTVDVKIPNPFGDSGFIGG